MNNTNIQQYTRLQQGILHVLCKTAGQRVNQRFLASKLQVTPAAVSRALGPLVEDGLVIMKDHGEMNLKEIELDRENHRVIQLKRVENLRILYHSDFVEAISERYAGCTIVLFGSYAKGEDTSTSDIDIAVFGTSEKKMDFAVYEKELQRPIRIMCVESLAKLSKEFRENICNGIVLSGSITL